MRSGKGEINDLESGVMEMKRFAESSILLAGFAVNIFLEPLGSLYFCTFTKLIQTKICFAIPKKGDIASFALLAHPKPIFHIIQILYSTLMHILSRFTYKSLFWTKNKTHLLLHLKIATNFNISYPIIQVNQLLEHLWF